MKYRLMGSSVSVAIVLGILSLGLVSMPAAQDKAADPALSVPTPRTADGHPDFDGFYFDPGTMLSFYGEGSVGDAGTLVRADDGSKFYNHVSANELGLQSRGAAQPAPASRDALPPYKPEYLAKVKATAADSFDNINPNDPYLQCKPLGIPRLIRPGHHDGFQIVQNPQFVAILFEEGPNSNYRIIYTDGRPHPSSEDLDSSYFGHSVGHWEGDVLVVDTVGLNDDTLLDGPRNGMLLIHSDQEHTVERFTRNGNVLTYEATVEDPVMLAQPWVITPRNIHLAAKEDFIRPQTCIEADAQHVLFGKNAGKSVGSVKLIQEPTKAAKTPPKK